MKSYAMTDRPSEMGQLALVLRYLTYALIGVAGLFFLQAIARARDDHAPLPTVLPAWGFVGLADITGLISIVVGHCHKKRKLLKEQVELLRRQVELLVGKIPGTDLVTQRREDAKENSPQITQMTQIEELPDATPAPSAKSAQSADRLSCPNCGTRLKLPTDWIHRFGRCPACKNKITIPT